MAGISSESLTAARQELEAKLPAAELTLAEELFDVLAMLETSAGLRRALTDPAREGKDKAALANRLVAGKVSPEAAEVVSGLAASRWANARDIGDALENLAATAAIAVAEKRSPGGRDLEKLEADLFSFVQVVNSDHDLQRALVDPQAGAEAKATLALKLVPQAGEEARLLIRQAVTRPRGMRPTALIGRFLQLVAERQQRWIADVTVSRALSAAQLERLQVGLNRLYGRELTINVNVDPSLIGGVRIRVGDEVVDSSVISRLSELRRKLAG